MNTQLARPHHDHQQQQQQHELDPQDAGVLHTTTEAEGGTGEEEHHGGVKSVLQKVKQKAKKVKDTLKVHGHHDHDHHHHHVPDDHLLDEEEDDDVDEEMIEDPAVHGATGHEAAVAAGLGSEYTTRTIQQHGHHDHGHHDQDHHHHHVPDDHDLDEEEDDDVDEEMIEDPAVHGAAGHEAAVAAGLGSGVPGKSSAGAMQPDYYDGGYSAADPMKMTPLEAGENRGGQMKMTPLEAGENRGGQGRKLADIKEEPLSPFNNPATVSSTTPVMAGHHRGTEPARDFVGQREEDRGHPQITMDEVTGAGLEEDPHGPKGSSGGARSPSNHQTKVTYPTCARGEEAAIPLTLIESLEKAHISEEGKHSQGNDGGLRRRTRDVASVLPTGSHDQFSPEATRPQPMSNFESAKYEDKTVTHIPGDHIGEAAHNQSSYSDKISSATGMIADKAIFAKNAVASKLGYGETAGDQHQQPGSGASSNSASPVEYGKKIAATVTEKLAPVYETVTSTVASAGNRMMSRVHCGGGGSTTSDIVTASEGDRKGSQQEKGVSVKDYLVEKLKPTEDDKALSDVISESLPWRKTAAAAAAEERRKPMGKVTESEEVKKRLGSDDDRKKEEVEVEDSSVSIPDVGGVGGKLKGAVESWFGKGQQHPPSFGDQSVGTQGFSGSGDTGRQGTGTALQG